MKTHAEYVAHRMAVLAVDGVTLSEDAHDMVRWHSVMLWRGCELCGQYPESANWQIGKTLVFLSATKETKMRLVPVYCGHCGNTKLIPWKIMLQNEKIRIMQALAEEEPSIMAAFDEWAAKHQAELRRKFGEEHPVAQQIIDGK